MTRLAFTREQAPEALYKNGARIKKVWSEPGDATPLGTGGTVLGSVHAPGLGVAYFITWDDKPGIPMFVIERKIG